MLDFCKAFDSLEWEFIFQVLEHFNFGVSLISWIKTLYNDPIAHIKNNGHLSRAVHLERSVRQGCPVSALLFILSVEILAIKIREDNEIKGFDIPGSTDVLKIVQYADDGVVFCNNLLELDKTIELIKTFGNIAGTQLNLSKCEGLWLGTFKQRQQGCNYFDIKWPLEPIRCLGIYIGHDKDQTYFLNWTKKLEDIETLLHSWKKRELTLFGKISVLKQLALPKILFSMSMLYTPDHIIKELNKIFFNFLWGKREFVKRNTMFSRF